MRRMRTRIVDTIPSDDSSDDELNIEDYYERPVSVAGIRPFAGLRPPTVPPPLPPMPIIQPESAVAELNQFCRDFWVNNFVMGIR